MHRPAGGVPVNSQFDEGLRTSAQRDRERRVDRRQSRGDRELGEEQVGYTVSASRSRASAEVLAVEA
jgi:hypothetical protein